MFFCHESMSDRLKNNIHELCVLNKLNNIQRKHFLEIVHPETIKCICEVCLNVLNGNIPLKDSDKNKLKRYKSILRQLVNRQGKKGREQVKNKRKTLIQKGGFLPIILPPLLAIAADLVVDLVRNKI